MVLHFAFRTIASRPLLRLTDAPARQPARIRLVVAGLLLCLSTIVTVAGVQRSGADAVAGVRDPAWAPDGRRLALSFYDRLHLATPDGRIGAPLVEWTGSLLAERDPAWSPDGARVAFAADTGNGFDLYVVAASGGPATRVTAQTGDERWPSWTHDGRLVFAIHDSVQWDLAVIDVPAAPDASPGVPQRLLSSADNEQDPAVAPDGTRIAFVSDRGNEDGDFDVWVMPLPPAAATTGLERVARTRGDERRPSWAPDGDRLVVSALRENNGSLWVFTVPPPSDAASIAPRVRLATPPVLVSRQAGLASWSPDGRTLAVANLPVEEPTYNGNPLRDGRDAPPLFAGGSAFQWRFLPAPLAPDQESRIVRPAAKPDPTRWTRLFDEVWGTLQRLYYRSGPAADAWRVLGDRFRSRAGAATSEDDFEDVVDEMVAAQPLIKRPVASRGAVVVSGHRLASEAGVAMLERGGNVVDAAVAVSFALGVVEPDASGIGGDGMAVLYLKGMSQPVVVDFKDQTPSHATLDNPRIMREGRLVADGPAAANIPGVVAGLDLLFRQYASRKVAWADVVAPAIALAEQGYELDEALPTTIAEGRGYFEKYPAAARIFLPDGRVPTPGSRFANADYAATLRTIAREGADDFYRGSIARRIAADMTRNGGIIGYDDLAQYRAIERAPVAGTYRGHRVYSTAPPVSSGVALIESLQILGHYPPAAAARLATDADYFHYLIEAWKARDTARRIADPALWPVDLGDHLDPAHAERRFQRIARDTVLRMEPDVDENTDASRGQEGTDRIGRGTTSFVVADAAGNVIAVTQTLSTWGGTFYVSEGLGFLYNNHLRSNRTRAGTYAQLMPLMRSSSTSAPTLVFRPAGEAFVPWLALAAAGNAWITPSVYSMLTAMVDGAMSMQAAIEAPRFLVTRDPADPQGTAALIQIEDRVPRRTLADLEARGHRFAKIGRKGEVRYGYAAAVAIDVQAGRVEGGAEPRRSHAATAWQPIDGTGVARPLAVDGDARREPRP